MSVHTYKKVNGKIVSELIPAESLEGQLASGWTVDKSSLEGMSKKEVDTGNGDKLSPDEIRQAAKEAGIEDYEKKRIKTLEAELWPTPKLT